jgi:hypothetical protein
MPKVMHFALFLVPALVACGADRETTDLDRRARAQVQVEGRQLHLDVFANRDFMPISPSTGAFYLVARLKDDRGTSPRSGLRADSVWIIDRSSRWRARSWKTRLTSDSATVDGSVIYRADPEQGPDADATIDVVVRLWDTGGQAYLLAARRVRVSRTD